MDELDQKLVGLLASDGRMSITDLADSLPLSISATRDRLRRLESTGVIAGFTVQLDLTAVGQAIEALVDVRLGPAHSTAGTDAAIAAMAPVIQAQHLTGRFDMQLHVVASDVAELDDLLTRLREEAGAVETNTRLVLRELDGFPRPPLALLERSGS